MAFARWRPDERSGGGGLPDTCSARPRVRSPRAPRLEEFNGDHPRHHRLSSIAPGPGRPSASRQAGGSLSRSTARRIWATASPPWKAPHRLAVDPVHPPPSIGPRRPRRGNGLQGGGLARDLQASIGPRRPPPWKASAPPSTARSGPGFNWATAPPAVETSGTPRRGRGRLPSARCRALDTARAGRAPSGPRGLVRQPPGGATGATEYRPKEAP